MEQELYKTRSLSACLKSALDTVCNNAKTIITNTWLPALVCALVAAAMAVINGNSTIDFVLRLVIFLVAIVANAFLLGKVATMLNGRKLKLNFKRFVLVGLLTLGLTILAIMILAAVFAMTNNWALSSGSTNSMSYAMIACGVIILIMGIALLPTAYSCMNYVYGESATFGSIFGKPYKTGLKSWGFLFMIHLLLGIICTIALIPILAVPFILGIANAANMGSMMLGDENGLPSYFIPLYYFASVLSSFIFAYIAIWAHITTYYAYGNIKYKHNEKLTKEQNNG